MKPSSLILHLGCLLSLASIGLGQISFVQESESAFSATAISNSRHRVLSIDKSTGQVLRGLVATDGSIQWQDPIVTGVENATGAALWKNTRTAAVESLALTAPDHNRIELLADNATEPYGMPVTDAVGPFTLAGAWSASLTGPLFAVTSISNDAPAYRIRRQAEQAPSSPAAVDLVAASPPRAANAIPLSTSASHLGFVYEEKLQLGTLNSAGSFVEHGTLRFEVESPFTRWTYGNFLPAGSFPRILDFVPHRPSFHSRAILYNTAEFVLEFDQPASFNLGKNIARLSTIPLPGGGSRLIVVFSDGTSSLYDFDGVSAPVLKATYPGGDHQFALPIGDGRIALLSGDGIASAWATYDATGNSPSTTPLASGRLPELRSARAPRQNVFLLQGEPFVNPSSQLFGGNQQAEWTSTPGFTGGQPRPLASNVNVRGETLAGEAEGLQPTGALQSYTDSTPGRFLLPNQHTPTSSLISFKTAAENRRPQIHFSPPPGHYPLIATSGADTPAPTVVVRLTSSSGESILYRTSPESDWLAYSQPIELRETTQLEARSASAAIRRAHYEIEPSAALSVPAMTDANRNGLSDAWEEAFGITDPNGDADGDGVNNLTEHNAGTDPLDPESVPPDSSLDGIALRAELSPEGGTLILTWPEGLGNVILESSSDLVEWTSVDPQPATNRHTILIRETHQFFRLRKP